MAASQNKFSSNLLAIAGFITAIGGLVTVLHQTGAFSSNDAKKPAVQEHKIEPQKLASDSEAKLLTNDPSKSQEDMEAIKQQLQQTQKQLQEIKNVGSQQSVPTTTINTNTASATILTGTWQDAISYGRYVLAQDAYGGLSFQEHSIIENEWIVTAEGTGSLSSNTMTLNYMTLYGTSGRFNGQLQNDGSIKGVATDLASGIQTQLHLRRQ